MNDRVINRVYCHAAGEMLMFLIETLKEMLFSSECVTVLTKDE